MALLFRKRTFQYQFHIQVYPQFPEAVLDHKADYRRVTEPFAGVSEETHDLHV